MENEQNWHQFRRRCEQGGLNPKAVAAFRRMYFSYRQGATGKVPWEEVSPAGEDDVVPLQDVESGGTADAQRLGRMAWIVLNGGLGTSMKMDRAKSLLPVKQGKTFLDLLAEHVTALRQRWGVELPVLFMNSFATRRDTLEALRPHHLEVDSATGNPLPLDFLQHRFPRIREEDGMPFGRPEDREAWAPPGHGNLYLALQTSGVLEALLECGIRWVFVSNADNMGASPHPAVLEYMASHDLQFLMEVTAKTAADVKGGTLVRRNRRLHLLEIAQVEDDHVGDFQDMGTFPVFNTNNLWIDLEDVAGKLDEGAMDLPLIVNRKEVDGTPVVQLETAMGAAIGRFERTAGVLVPRERFAPVKTTDDLLVRRSDLYVRGERAPLVPSPARQQDLGIPVVVLDPSFYKSVPDLDFRIPEAPSLIEATRLELRGDVRFGSDVRVRGSVIMENDRPEPMRIPDGTVLSG